MRHTAVADAVTLAELLRAEPLRGLASHALAGLDREVAVIRLLDDVEQVRTCRPGTVAVLQYPAGRTAWACAVAVRYAWERNVRMIICDLDAAAAPSVIALAERLGVPLGIHSGDLPQLALDLASLIAHPEASRASLIAGCAARLTQARDVSDVLGILNSELPGVQVRLAVADDLDGPAATFRVPLAPLDASGRELHATVERGSVTWIRTVQTIVEIARAQVLACEALGHGERVERRALASWTLDRLATAAVATRPVPPANAAEPDETDVREDALAAARGLGWHIGPKLVTGVVLPAIDEAVTPELDLVLAASWPTLGKVQGPVRYGGGWVVWSVLDYSEERDESPDDDTGRREIDQAIDGLTNGLRQALASIRIGVPLVAGVGTPTESWDELSRSLRRAELAARVLQSRYAATADTGSLVAGFSGLGAPAFLAAADSPGLRELAGDTMAALDGLEDRSALLRTLAVYLDCGGSTSRAADVLGVHRNTVTQRMERLRRLGVDPDVSTQRLGLHMAAHLLAP